MVSIVKLGRETLKEVLETEMVNGVLNIPKEYRRVLTENNDLKEYLMNKKLIQYNCVYNKGRYDKNRANFDNATV